MHFSSKASLPYQSSFLLLTLPYTLGSLQGEEHRTRKKEIQLPIAELLQYILFMQFSVANKTLVNPAAICRDDIGMFSAGPGMLCAVHAFS